MRNGFITTRSLCAVTLLGVLGVLNLSWAQNPINAQLAAEAVKKAKRPKPDKGNGNGETIQERDRRLSRECKGRPNAGACEGYAN